MNTFSDIEADRVGTNIKLPFVLLLRVHCTFNIVGMLSKRPAVGTSAVDCKQDYERDGGNEDQQDECHALRVFPHCHRKRGQIYLPTATNPSRILASRVDDERTSDGGAQNGSVPSFARFFIWSNSSVPSCLSHPSYGHSRSLTPLQLTENSYSTLDGATALMTSTLAWRFPLQ